MNATKPLTFAASLLIACAGVAGIRAYANASAPRVVPAAVGAAAAQPIQTLPAIEVRPTAADYERAFGHSANAIVTNGLDTASLEGTGIDMPYYSFAKPAVGVR